MAYDYKHYFGEIAVLRGLTTITARARELVQDASGPLPPARDAADSPPS